MSATVTHLSHSTPSGARDGSEPTADASTERSRAAAITADDRVIQRVQRGDSAAYLELFDRYYPRIESYARWQLRNPDAAADMASETFLRAYRSIAGYRTGEGTPYLAYLLQICRRLIMAERSRFATETSRSMQQAVEETRQLQDESDMPLLYVLEEERRTMIHAALQALAPDDREIIHLAFERDLSRRDIAGIMGKPTVSAVTSHLYRAVQKLRAEVVRQGYFSGTQSAERR